GRGERLSRFDAGPVRAAVLAGQRPPTVVGDDGRVVAASPDLYDLCAWHLGERRPLLELSTDFVVARLALCPNAPLLAAAGFDGELEVYGLDDGALVSRLPPRPEGIAAAELRFHPTRPAIFVPLDDGALELWAVDGEARLLQRWPEDADPNSGPIDV